MRKLFIRLFSKMIGKDQFGNRYFISRAKDYLGRNKRFVIYNGIEDGSKVPAMWHSWLHYLSSKTPEKEGGRAYSWQKKHMPNVTGTKYAHNVNVQNEEISAHDTTYVRWNP
ncbi:NADH-ubiquinone oxidoreductase subunit NDUFA12 family protein [Rickettsiaceae bacterium]|nr:NADH-ubiquinone oxidoreductase subunit NDUFA12 family protein [Rickettsiaceae bacterium]